MHEVGQYGDGGVQLLNNHRGLVYQPNFASLFARLFAREQGNRGIHIGLLLAKVQYVAVGFGAVEHAVGA